MKYIDAEKLKKAIEEKGLDCSFALKMERLDTLALIDSLQQDQPEIDIEKEIDKLVSLEYDERDMCIARHFYELGKNARKEE